MHNRSNLLEEDLMSPSTFGDFGGAMYNMLMQAPVGIVVFKGDNYIIELANDLYLPIAGKSRKELLNQPAFDVMPIAARQGFIELLNNIRATGKPMQLKEHKTLIERHGNIDTTYLNIVYQPLKEENGLVTRIMILVTDVTEQVTTRIELEEANQRIQESEERFRSTFENAAVGIAHVGLDGRWLLINNQLTQILGYTKDELLQLSFQDITHPDDLQTDLNYVQQMLKGEISSYAMEKRYIRKDGEIVWAKLTVSLLHHDDNTPKNFVSVIEDISLTKQAEDRLVESEQRFRSIADEAPAFLFIADKNAEAEYLNKTWLQFVGMSNEEAKGRAWVQVTHPEDIEMISQVYSEAFAERKAYEFQVRQKGTDGEYRWILWRGIPRIMPNGDFVGMMGIGIDVTAAQKASEALKESEELFRSFSNNITNLAWIADGEGWIFWYNQRWYDYTGTSLEEMQGWGWEKVHHPHHIERVLAFVKEAWKKGETWELTFPLRSADGNYKWFLTRAVPIKDEAGKVIRWIGTNTDIDEQKKLSENLEAAVKERTKELQRSNDDLQQFAHVTSHDLKEPARKVRTFANRLIYEFESQLPEKAKLYVEKMENASERMYSMIDGVLLYSSLGAAEMVSERIDLNEIIASIEIDLEVIFTEKKAAIKYHSLSVVEGSSVLIYQLFYNLVYNSLKFAKPNTPPFIKITAEDCDGSTIAEKNLPWQNKYVRIVLEDNGIGFDPAQAEKIFRPFSRLHSRESYEGTGLGLALCKKIVERHQGLITAEGKPGEGATFYIYLPTVKE